MKGFNLIDNSDKHFLLQAPNGAKVKIAKLGLSKATIDKIQSFAKGGKVEYSASPQNTLNTEAAENFKKSFSPTKPEFVAPKDPKKVAQYSGGTGPGGVQVSQNTQEDSQAPNTQLPQGGQPPQTVINIGQPQGQQQVQTASEPTNWVKQIGDTLHSISQNPIAKAIVTGDTSHLNPQATPAVDTLQPGSAMQSQVQPNPRNVLQTEAPNPVQNTSQNGIVEKITQNERTPTVQQAQAIKDLQTSQGNQLTELDKQYTQLKNTDEDFNKKFGPESQYAKTYQTTEQRFTSNVQELAKIRQSIEERKTPPQNMFANKSTFGKIGTALSVLLGGVSQGLTGATTNPVMDFINKQIERDNEHEKFEYGKIRNRYTMLREEGLTDQETLTRLRAEKMQAVMGLIHINQAKTQNIAARSALEQAKASLTLQSDAAAKQMTNDQMLRQYLSDSQNIPGTSTTTPSGQQSNTSAQMLPASYSAETASNPTALKQHKATVEKQFTEIAKSVPRLAARMGQEKLTPEAVKEVQRLRDAHDVTPVLLKLYKQAAEHRGEKRNLIREQAAVSGIMANIVPFLKIKEGTPREFEEKVARNLLPKYFDTDEDGATKEAAFIDFLQSGSNSSLLDSLQVPYPKLKLGGPRL